MIAFHYPPNRISSGIQRSLKFSRYLLDAGWTPSVLTVHPRACQQGGDDQLDEIPEAVEVRRAFALDTARHLSIRGRYPGFLALPDRWVTWWLGGVWSGLGMIRRQRPQILWSTYPVATAHLIALTLRRLTGLPWIADLRDSMTEEDYPTDPTVRRVYRWIERKVVEHAERVVFTTNGAMRMYAERYPDQPADKWAVITNGYDEDNFTAAMALVSEPVAGGPVASDPVVLIHSGVLYPSERDPTCFFAALSALKSRNAICADDLRIRLRATANDELLSGMIDEYEIADIVSLEPSIPYVQALGEMLQADGLLVFQAANCNHQIPAKLYEYFRARRPLLGLTDPAGNTAEQMREAGITTIVRLDSRADIETGLLEFIAAIRSGTAPLVGESEVARYSRRAGTEKLAGIIEELTGRD